MNQVFSFKRWGHLVQRHYLENKRSFLYGILCLLGAMAITLGFPLFNQHRMNEAALVNIYLIGLYLIGAIFASSAFDMVQKKEKGIAYLTLPASHFEKLLTQILYNLIFFTIIYSLCFFVMSKLFIGLAKQLAISDPSHYSFSPADWDHPDEIMRVFWYLMYIFFGVQALFIAGSIYFKRFSFLLTTVILVIFITILIYYFNGIEHHYWRGKDLYFNNGKLRTLNGQPTQIYALPKALSFCLKWLMLLGWAPLLWLVSWFRLREKEI